MGVYKLSGAGGLLTPRVNYASMLAGNEAFELSSYQLISSTILESAASSVNFSSLATYASTYKHLQIRSACMVNASGNLPLIRFNGDTGSNYSSHYLGATGSGMEYGAQLNGTSMFWGYFPASSSSTQAMGIVTDILDAYSTTKNKTIRNFWGKEYVQLTSGNWRDTSAISSITILSPNNFIAGSRFSLYGIKG